MHFVFPNQHALASAFMRVQEFYESPIEDFRGGHFTRAEFKEAYMADRDADEFTYYDDWSGFNVPGDVMDKFMRTFDIDLSEKFLMDTIAQHHSPHGQYYVIGTFEGGDGTTVDHELSHAFWYLHPHYRETAEHLIETRLAPHFKKKAGDAIAAMGYHEDVIDDEIVAYLSTSTLGDLVETLDTEKIPWKSVLKFQQHFVHHLKLQRDRS